MKNIRKYGKPPYRVAVIHGGPGASGEMAPVARELSSEQGVLEPLQTSNTLEGQVKELRDILDTHGNLPITLIGHSWGAWLSFVIAARYPAKVRRLIIVGSGPFDAQYAEYIMEARLDRLGDAEKREVQTLTKSLNEYNNGDMNKKMARFGQLISKADSYDPLPHDTEVVEVQYDIYSGVWKDAEELRSSGKLLDLAKHVRCPVVAIHGDYDPHPAQGVEKPLSRILKDFRCILLTNCGHKPWIERQARDEFFCILKKELKS